MTIASVFIFRFSVEKVKCRSWSFWDYHAETTSKKQTAEEKHDAEEIAKQQKLFVKKEEGCRHFVAYRIPLAARWKESFRAESENARGLFCKYAGQYFLAVRFKRIAFRP